MQLLKRFRNSVCISPGVSPVSVMMLYISAICWCMFSGGYFISSTRISSHPGLLLGFILAITFWISSAVKSSAIRVGGMALTGCLFLQRVFSKYSSTILLCSVGLAVRLSFPFIQTGQRCSIIFIVLDILMLSFCMFSSSYMVFLTLSVSPS